MFDNVLIYKTLKFMKNGCDVCQTVTSLFIVEAIVEI